MSFQTTQKPCYPFHAGIQPVEGGIIMRGKLRKRVREGRAARWFVDIEWQGKRYQLFMYRGHIPCETETLGHLLWAEVNSEIERGVFDPRRYMAGAPLSLSAYAEKWLAEVSSRLSAATAKDYRNSLKNHILPALGEEQLPDINYPKLKELQASIHRSPKGKKNVMACLAALLREAKRDGFISQVPEFPAFRGANEIVPPKVRWLPSEDQMKILEAVPGRHRPVILFMMLTGCRPAEARALHKRNVLQDRVVFEHAFGAFEELKAVKSKRPREFPMTDALRACLDSAHPNLSHLVFVNPDTGTPYTKNIPRIWNRAVESLGLDPRHIPLYSSTRHSFACQALAAGLDFAAVSKLLGHSNLEITKRYAEHQTVTLAGMVDKVHRLRQHSANTFHGGKKKSK